MHSQSLVSQVISQQEIKITHLQEHIRHLQSQFSTIKRSLENYQVQNTTLSNELKIKEDLLKDRNRYIQKLEQSNLLLEKNRSSQGIKVISLVDQNQLDRKSIIQLSHNLTQLEQKNYNLLLQIKILNEKNSDVILQRDSFKNQLEQIDLLRNQNSEIHNRLMQYSKQNGLLRKTNIEFQKNSKVRQQNIMSLINQQFDSKLKQIQIRSENQVLQLKKIVSDLTQVIDQKNKTLQKYDYELIEKLNELETAFPNTNRDQIQSIKNAIKFMSQELKKKSQVIKVIKQKYNTFQEYNEKNNKLINSLKADIKAQTNQIDFLKKQNNKLSKQSRRTSLKSSNALQKQIEELKSILNQLLWENQACHMILHKLVGHNFKHSVDKERQKLRQQFNTIRSKNYGSVDNKYLTVEQLINKNDELMKQLNRILYGV